MIHGPARHKLTEADWRMFERIGVGPVLALSLYPLADFQRLYDMGYRDLTLRLWHDWGVLPAPDQFLDQHSPMIDALIAMGFRVAVKASNEPNLENKEMGIDGFRQWFREVRLLFRARYPQLELLSPALSPNDAAQPWAWLEGLRNEYAACDTIAGHFYLRTAADLEPGAPWSPEWYLGQFPAHNQRITECGGADDTPRSWRYSTYPPVFQRWIGLPYVASFHPFVMSAEDAQWTEKGHTYDDVIVATLASLAAMWRAVRGVVPKLSTVEEEKVPEEQIEYRFGFKDLYEKDPQLMGKPISEQKTIPGAFSYQFTENGIALFDPESNTSRFFRKAL